MDKNKCHPADHYFCLNGQCFHILKQIFTFLRAKLKEMLPGLFASVSPPLILCPIIVTVSQCFDHHVLVVAQKQRGVLHLSNALQKRNSVRTAVNHIAQHIQMIVRLEADHGQNRLKCGAVTVDIR